MKINLLFITFFGSQCSLIKNTSVLPTNHESVTDKSLSSITFGDNYSGKIIKGLDPNKTYGHDMKIIRMLKFCGGPIWKSLWLTFRACFDQRLCPFAGKEPTLSLFIKQSIKNYRPVSLLAICAEAIERLYNYMISFFIEEDLIS